MFELSCIFCPFFKILKSFEDIFMILEEYNNARNPIMYIWFIFSYLPIKYPLLKSGVSFKYYSMKCFIYRFTLPARIAISKINAIYLNRAP